ncbi:MAG: nucleoside triphosphate pyrophosphohydrolase [Planctomycetota bacterium]
MTNPRDHRKGTRPLDPPPATGDERLDALARLLAILDRLRAPGGCPWDREQTVDSMGPSLVEEAHEAQEAIERRDDAGTVEELGDLLVAVGLIGRIASEEGRFDVAAAARAAGDKLIRRHPHVFGDVEVTGSEHVLQNWERIKRDERTAAQEDASALAGVPVALPALQRVQRLSAKAIAAGFRWADDAGALQKVAEEVEELREAFAAGPAGRARLESELGDVLLATAIFATYVGIDPERATRRSLRRFEARFRHMEAAMGERFRGAPLDAMMAAWRAAKESTGEEA